jgi:hypothetical protein
MSDYLKQELINHLLKSHKTEMLLLNIKVKKHKLLGKYLHFSFNFIDKKIRIFLHNSNYFNFKYLKIKEVEIFFFFLLFYHQKVFKN